MAKALYKFHGKALSIGRPWGSAIAFGGKNIENRDWQTHYRGPLAIHESGKIDRDALEKLCRVVRGGEKRPLREWINRGRGSTVWRIWRRPSRGRSWPSPC